MIMAKVKKQVKGSFTVEAAFVLPVILIIIFSFFYLVFYEHDKVRAETILYETVRNKEQEIYAMRLYKRLSKEEYKLNKKENDLFEQGFFMLRKIKEDSDKNFLFIRESISMSGKCSILYLDEWLKKTGLSFQRDVRFWVYNPMELLRLRNSLSEDEDIEKKWEYEYSKADKVKDLVN